MPHRLVAGVLEGTAPGRDRYDLRAQRVHPQNVELLPLDVALAHEHGRPEAQERRGGGRGDAVLARAGLGQQPLPAHPVSEQRLADHIVDLV
ncbi:hypothetical protein GCM10018952_27810 [Streptosporangium vulgare]